MMEKENKKPRREIGIREIIYWMFIVLGELLFIFSGMITIQEGQLFIGVLLLVLAVLVFVPRKFFRVSKALKVLILAIIYFALLTMSGIDTSLPEQQYEHYNLEQPFNLTFGENVFSVVVNDVSTDTTLVIDGKEISTPGIYFFVNGAVTNLGKIPLNFDFQSELRDSEDNLYTPVASAGDLDAVQPNLERKFSYIFEIPKEIFGLKLIVKDKTDIDKMVDLE
jgi:hypothetical protein